MKIYAIFLTIIVKNKLIINLNKGKTKVMLFSSAQQLKTHGKLSQIVYQGHTINFLTEYKYFGAGIDSHLTLNDNFDKSYQKTSSHCIFSPDYNHI